MPDFRFAASSPASRVSRDQRIGLSGYSLSKSANTRPPSPPKETMATLSIVGACSTSVPPASELYLVPTESKVTSTTPGGWPTPVPRARGMPQAIQPSSALQQPGVSPQGSRTGKPSLSRPPVPTNSMVSASTFKAAHTTSIQSLKGTMETLSAHSSTGCSCNPTVSSRSGTLGTSDKASDSSLPSKLVNMRQNPVQELAPLHRVQAQPLATPAQKPLPPHLRKRQTTSSVDTVWTTQAYEHSTEAEPATHELTSKVDTVWTTPAYEHPIEAEPKLQQVNGFLSHLVEAETRTVQRNEVSMVITYVYSC
jgi:hypothetical protein